MIEKGYQSVIDLIFSNSWDISVSLIWAVSKRDNRVLKVILDGGVDVNTVGHVRTQYWIRCANDLIVSYHVTFIHICILPTTGWFLGIAFVYRQRNIADCGNAIEVWRQS